MKPELKKLISEHLRDSITREDLSNREAAEMLKIQPGYISLVFNEKHRDSCPANAWEKLEAWHTSRQTLKEWQNFGQYVEQIKEDKTEPKETPVLPIPGPENEPEKIKPVKVSKPKVKQKRKTDPDKIQAEAFESAKDIADHFGVPLMNLQDLPSYTLLPENTAHMKVALDIEINLVVNGQKVQVK